MEEPLELPLELRQVLIDEQRALGIRAHLVDVAALAQGLKSATELSRSIRGRLSSATQNKLEVWTGGDVPALLQTELIDELDRLLGESEGTDAEQKAREELARACSGAFAGLDEKTPDTLGGFYRSVHARRKNRCRPRAALCLSGGGIRSATFGLGVLQGLAERRLLDEFDYLSTVSGGGYIGSWLSAWIHRHPRGRDGVMEDLAKSTGRPLDPEATPIRHLREYSNYLTPRAGLFTADTWTGVATYLRNLILNWLVLLPLLAFVLALPRLGVSVLRSDAAGAGVAEVAKVVKALGIALAVTAKTLGIALAVVAAALLIWSIVYIAAARPSLRARDDGAGPTMTPREYTQRFLLRCLYPLVGGATILAMVWGWTYDPGSAASLLTGLLKDLLNRDELPTVLVLGGFVSTGVVLHALAYIAYFHRLQRGTRIKEGWRVLLSGAVGGFLAWAAAMKIFGDWSAREYAEAYVVFGAPVMLVIILLTATLFVGLMSRLMDDEDREWSARFGAFVIMVGAAWLVVGGLSVFGPRVLDLPQGWYTKAFATAGGASGLFTLATGWSSRTSGSAAATPRSGLAAAVMRNAITIVAAIFAAFVAVILSWATSALMARIFMDPDTFGAYPTHQGVLMNAGVSQNLLTIAVLLVIGYSMSRFINANKFSLHAMYRSRLIRAYLGASRMARNPNGFTGFDPSDNVQMHELRTELRVEIGEVDLEAFRSLTRPPETGLPLVRRAWRATRNLLPGSSSAPKDNVKTEDLRRKRSVALRALLRARTLAMLDCPVRREEDQHKLRLALLQDLNGAIYTNRKIFSDDFVKLLPDFAGLLARYKPVDLADEALLFLNRDVLTAAATPAIEPRLPPAGQRPLHVVNIALNLVAGSDLAWQERKAESFTASPLHAGSWPLGYRRAKEYGGAPDGISLGTAVAISGAAASPNQGYHSSPLVTFLMALFNVRLGWWLGNPGPSGDESTQNVARAQVRETFEGLQSLVAATVGLPDGAGPTAPRSIWNTLTRPVRAFFGKAVEKGAPAYTLSYPDNSITPLLQETLGLTDDQSPFVYLSDGGHFENLGLYEMVLRRCHVIVVSDAGCDPDCSLEDLGNAIRKIRVDFGIPIVFNNFPLYGRTNPAVAATKGQTSAPQPSVGQRQIPQPSGLKYCALGDILYKEIDGKDAENGLLVYIKPAFYGESAPRDIFNYATANATFPHETTLNQWFSESQFESYRMLGRHAVEQICEKIPQGVDLNGFCHGVGSYVVPPSAAGAAPVSSFPL